MTTKTILSRILFLLYLACIAFLCFARFDNISGIQREFFGIPTDKIVHFMMFLPFPILSYLSFDHPSKKVWKSVLFISVTFVVGCAIGLATEYIQSFLPYRSFDLKDLHTDGVAISVSSLVTLIVDLTRKKR